MATTTEGNPPRLVAAGVTTMMAATAGLDSGGTQTETAVTMAVTGSRETDLVGSETATKVSTAASSVGAGSEATTGQGTETMTGIEVLVVVAGESMGAASAGTTEMTGSAGMIGIAGMTGTTGIRTSPEIPLALQTLRRGSARSCSSSLALCPWKRTRRPLPCPRPPSLHLRPRQPFSAERDPWIRLPESVRSKHGLLGSVRKKSADRSGTGNPSRTVARTTG